MPVIIFEIIQGAHSAFTHTLLATIVVSTMWAPYSILRARDHIYQIRNSELIEHHEAWHNLYIGLGVGANPFGISWEDSNGAETVKRIDPSVRYLSNEYYAKLRQQYFSILLHQPLAVLAVYGNKLKKALNSYSMAIVLFVIAAVFARTCYYLGGQASSLDDLRRGLPLA